MADSQGNDNTTCVVCFKNVLYYSIGECDHPVCFECSTRMRVLCLQNECPICRQDLARVVFTETVLPYKELRNKVFNDRLFERQFKIGFCTQEIKNAYDKLLENHCKMCDKIPPFRTFAMLSDHMRRVHERFFCDLCVKHLRIFTSERKCYTRQELAHHRRKGDLDDTSHRGHPLCEFCEERFMDADELYRHLRKEHLYCHLCDADGRNLYYASHSALAHHFRTDHFLCEEGECAEQHLTSVFRSEIDLKAHKATVHGRGMNRGAARQARTLELQFNITPHPVAHRAPHRNPEPRPEPQSPPPQSPRIDTLSVEQFPRLSAAQPQHSLSLAPVKHYNAVDGLTRNERNFPALDGAGAGAGCSSRPARPGSQPVAAVLSNSKPSVSIQLHSQPASASNFRLTQTSGNRISIPQHQKKTPLNDDDFPSLSRDDHPNIGAGTVQPPKVTMINSQEMNALKSKQQSFQARKPSHGGEAFPALSGGGAPAAPPQWITVSSKGAKPGKAKEKPNRPEPPPQPSFNPFADFPTLPVNNSKPISNAKPKKTLATPTQPPVIHTESKASKKDKKKQNNNAAKKENVNEFAHVNGAIDKKIAREMSYVGIGVDDSPNAEVQKKVKTVEAAAAAASEGDRNGGHGDFTLAARDYPPLSAWPAKRERPLCNGLTFTNSSGQTFSAPLHAYIPPVDFERRNRELVKKFAVALGGAAAVEEFKVASRAFRDGVIAAEEFYSHCRAALGAQLEAVFPELVALLPDIAKQQELVVGRAAGALAACDSCGQLLAPADRGPHAAAHWPPLAPR
ncbi:E3 ubiquitin-protein ligase ZNF598 [Plodia interpunctella]|uniref:E3 ubiquitin-protein ligase ZNF598 n=1 Tax=Plodia interpunctella TaxID=58824 RepID=UPI002368A399|nr:E3 ubiquitin-protein ligase ZNF598 [Plodia interpunctella]XP_053607928.1 E3 ubiquitin-protein ligase ZNF598 [Plodia interpunctella]XP_053607929.1 E3 ubiquitin-protein ligase ZNF598 [Plodia interpunctella]XP_053607930.1 E3 ubiquitin-protein ligase ZNF598 [Plodia interpunctella]